MSNIFVRSPFIVEIDEVGQTASKVELFIWNTGSQPAEPQYVLTKNIPASNNTQTTYNISPMIREYINFALRQNPYNTTGSTINAQKANVVIKTYKFDVTYTLLDTLTYMAFDGYGYYNDGYNYDAGDYHLDEGTYYYYLAESSNPSANTNERGGFIRLLANSGDKRRWTDLVTGLQSTATLTAGWIDLPRLNPSYYTNGNLLEILDAGNNVLASWIFRPIEECKYETVVCDFVNRYGSWQREWFFKASQSTLNIESIDYNLMQQDLVDYDVLEGQRKSFNTNGKEQIKVNTGWVDESWNNTLKQMMLSERILINDLPAKLNTKSQELLKHINKNLINYTLDFEFTYNIINSVV